MKSLEKIIILVIIVVPIVICSVVLKSIWSDDDKNKDDSKTNGGNLITEISDPYYSTSGEENNSGDNVTNDSGDVKQMGGETFISKIGDPISKVYTDASISSASANIYSEASGSAEIVGKFEKYTKVTAQKFEQGWSRVTGKDSSGASVSGWMKTENISYPDGNGSTLNTETDTKTGTITAEPYLNVRANPSTTATIITTVKKGATVTIKESSNGWYKILVNNLTGWVSADYVKVK